MIWFLLKWIHDKYIYTKKKSQIIYENYIRMKIRM